MSMTKEKLKQLITKHLGYAEQEIYDAIDQLYSENEVKDMTYFSMMYGIRSSTGLIKHRDQIIPAHEKWFKENKKNG